ncbi:MAG TPA: Hsp70 family protein, partial [Nannocystis exedens]|nr:Hsp70 family protein [Nannocystis exedens]
MAHAIGIDLGTTELRAAIYGASGGEEARASLFRLGKEDLKMPAAVGVDAEGELVVGDRARRLQIMRPRSIVKTPLALLGTRFDDLDLDSWAPLRLVRDPRGDTRVRLGERTFAPVQLVAAQLLALRSQIEEVSAEPLPPVTLTVPAGLGNLARRGLVDACTIAGVHLQRLLPATTAAAIEIHAQGDPIDEPTLAICDLGGGSFSAAIVEFREGGITVLGSASAVDAGARDIDRRLAERLAQEAAISCEKPDLCDDPVALVRLLDASEKAKIGLSDARERAVYLPFLSADVSGTKHLETLIAQAELEENIEDLIQRWLAVVQRALADSNRTLDDLRDVVLIGRGSHLPLLQDRLEEALERTPNLRWQDASGEATSEPASAPKVSRLNRSKKAKKTEKNSKAKGSKGDLPEESEEVTEEDAADDVQGALGRRDGRGRNRYPVAFGAARMAAMLAGDPTIDVLEIDDVLGRPITFERGILEPPTPPSAISSKAPGTEVESAAKLPELLEASGEFDALEVDAGEIEREEEKKGKEENKEKEEN